MSFALVDSDIFPAHQASAAGGVARVVSSAFRVLMIALSSNKVCTGRYLLNAVKIRRFGRQGGWVALAECKKKWIFKYFGRL